MDMSLKVYVSLKKVCVKIIDLFADVFMRVFCPCNDREDVEGVTLFFFMIFGMGLLATIVFVLFGDYFLCSFSIIVLVSGVVAPCVCRWVGRCEAKLKGGGVY